MKDHAAWINVTGCIVIIGVVTELPLLTYIVGFINIPVPNRDLFSQLVAGYIVQLAAVVAFFVGTNRGSKQSEDTIHRLVSNPPPPAPPATVVPAGSTVTATTTIDTPPTGDPQ